MGSNGCDKFVAPGERLELELMDASRGLMTPESTGATLADCDPGNANPLTGPIYVDGALFSAGDGHAAQDAARYLIDQLVAGAYSQPLSRST